MELIKDIDTMRSRARELRASGKTIGFVPTMGFLHEGHLSLMRLARPKVDYLVASIFVNPTQFAPNEDLAAYPRDLSRDLELMGPVPVDAVFFPTNEQMYPPGFQTTVEVTELTKGLCGAFRATHFGGVTLVVNKLFNIVTPHLAVFGWKDFQQLTVIKRMVADLNMDIEILGGEIVREPDGLAMSSRNSYLSARERQAALCLGRALARAGEMAKQGEANAQAIIAEARAIIEAEPLARVQYITLADPETLTEVKTVDQPAVLALAVFVGQTRLLDNAVIEPGT